ncbi:MAG: hypothetical protein GY854_25155 [Deltaproteobacteria bacterium]|nr:hypothetical protein [Deltaproteobacteria bacterium]
MSVKKTGDWSLARRLLTAAPLKLKAAAEVAIRQEAEAFRREIVQGITKQAPGGKAFKPLSQLTLAARRMAGFKGTKALMVRADLRNAIAAIVRGSEAFIGVPRKGKDKDGKPVIDIAELNEYGSKPIVIPITAKMRRFLFALFAEAGVQKRGSLGNAKGVVVTRIPPRPFLQPVFKKLGKGVHERFLKRVAKRLGFGVF